MVFSINELLALGLTVPEYDREHELLTSYKEQISIAVEHDLYHNLRVPPHEEMIRAQGHVVFFIRANKAVQIPGVDCNLAAGQAIDEVTWKSG